MASMPSPNDKSIKWLFHKALIEEICQNFIPEDTRVAISSSPASLELCHCTKVHISWDRNAITATSIKEANLCQSPQPKERSMPCPSIFYRLETTNLLLDYSYYRIANHGNQVSRRNGNSRTWCASSCCPATIFRAAEPYSDYTDQTLWFFTSQFWLYRIN